MKIVVKMGDGILSGLGVCRTMVAGSDPAIRHSVEGPPGGIVRSRRRHRSRPAAAEIAAAASGVAPASEIRAAAAGVVGGAEVSAAAGRTGIGLIGGRVEVAAAALGWEGRI